MEKMLTQFGVTVATQRQLHLKKHLAGNLAGDTEEVERETQEAGVNSLVESGASSTLMKPREAGMRPVLPLRTHRLVLGAEL